MLSLKTEPGIFKIFYPTIVDARQYTLVARSLKVNPSIRTVDYEVYLQQLFHLQQSQDALKTIIVDDDSVAEADD